MWWQSVGVGRRQTVGRKLSIERRERTRPPLGLPSSRVPRSQGGNATQGHSPPFTLTHFASLCGKCVSTMQLLEPKAPRAQRIARSISNTHRRIKNAQRDLRPALGLGVVVMVWPSHTTFFIGNLSPGESLGVAVK
uniref:Uncharacterized protein n=1 Tax=Anopheles coluzzii TaxID=1518534 RepID=A0A8W7Q313_ANOCL